MSEIFIRHYAGVVGVALLTYDLILEWEREVQCIWRSSKWIVKGTYVMARYLGLALQIFNLIYINYMTQFERLLGCRAWFQLQGAAASALTCNLELILILRVYALYDGNFILGTSMAILFFSSGTAYAVLGVKSVRTTQLDSDCLPVNVFDRYVMMLIGTMVANQIVLWGLTVYGYWASVKQRFFRNRNPILRVVIRDNSCSCLALCIALASGLQLGIQELVHIMPCAWSALLSLVSCRLILNMRSLRVSNGSQVQQSPDPEVNTEPVEDSDF